MKFSTVATLITATAGVVAAQPHHRHHRHQHKRSPVADAPDAMATVVVFEIDGQVIPADVAEKGLADGEFVMAGPDLSMKVDGSFADIKTLDLKPAAMNPTAPKAPSIAATHTETSGFGAGPASGAGSAFPNGQIDCDTFPVEYGALPVNYLGLGGWTGIQQPGSTLGGFSDILTVVSDSCNGANCCSEGSFCSYACAEGLLKSQWPSEQGATGQSVGGLQCRNGKLWLTNPSLSNNLCIPGASEVKVLIQNNLSQQVAVCATDYPGLESETIPLAVMPNQVNELACPDSSTYYQWEGKGTSRQYYLNPAGFGVDQACQWGTSSLDIGNFAPMNLGVGYSDGNAYLSMFQNSPTTSATLDYSVKIVGDNISGACTYSGGQYCNASGCNAQGCTVSAASGTITYILSQ